MVSSFFRKYPLTLLLLLGSIQNFQDLCYLHNSGSLSYHSSRLSCFMLNAFRVHTLNPRPDQGPGSPQWPLFTSPHFYWMSMSVKKKKKKKLLSLRTVLQWFLKQWNIFFFSKNEKEIKCWKNWLTIIVYLVQGQLLSTK